MTLAARNRLVLEHLPLVLATAKRVRRKLPRAERDDLVNEGVLGLLACIERYDPKHNVSFKTYAEHRVRGAMLDSLKLRQSKYASIAVVPDRVVERSEWPDAICEQRECERQVQQAAAQLPERLQTIVRLYYVGEMTEREVGGLFGVGQVRISQLRHRALDRMAATLKTQGVRL